MYRLLSPFWNWQERRVRSGWRLSVQLVVYILGQASPFLLIGAPESGPTPAWAAALPLTKQALFIFLGCIASLLLTWLVTLFLDRRKFADIGFQLGQKWWMELGFGLLLGALLMGIIFMVEWALGWVEITGYFRVKALEQTFWIALLSPIVLFVGVGIQEELLSRGYQIRNLAEGLWANTFGEISSLLLPMIFVFGLIRFLPVIFAEASLELQRPALIATVIAITFVLSSFFWLKSTALEVERARRAIILTWIATSAFFGLLHAANPNSTWISTFNIALAGIFLGVGYVLTGRLAIPIGLHITWNLFQGNIFGFPVSGNDFADVTLIAIKQGGPPLWTGGAFGPEAGLIGIAAITLGTLIIINWVRWRYGSSSLHHEIAIYPQRQQNVALQRPIEG